MPSKILSVGINLYPDAPLQGCVTDSRNMIDAWRSLYGVVADHTLQLLDTSATLANIKEGVAWLLDRAVPYEDVLVFHYSGHGTQIRDTDGDEIDRLDECLVPFNFSWQNPETQLTDDMLFEWLRPLPEGVNLTLVIDACHSGSLLRAMPGQPIVGYGRRIKCLPVRSEPLRTSLTAQARHGWRGLFGFAPPVSRFGITAASLPTVLISATTSRQLAADAHIDGAAQGAHTYALLNRLRADPTGSYAHLVASMRGWLDSNGYGGEGGQTPQLQGRRASRRLQAFAPYPRPA